MAESKAKTSEKSAKEPDAITDKEGKKVGGSSSDDKLMAAVSTIPIVGIIIYFAVKDASPYVKNYARQGATLFLVSLVLMVAMFLAVIPVIGWIISCLSFFVWIGFTVGWVVLLIKALQEEEDYQLPVVGDLSKSIFK